MPVYRQTYRTYEGEARPWFRWATMIGQELRVLFQSWTFRGLFGLGALHILFRALQVFSYDTVQSNPESPLAALPQLMAALTVNERMFFDFIRLQSPIVFLVTIMAGSGMICNDFRFNLVEIYFSKPLTWRDYVLGKTCALGLVGLLLTAIPGVFLLVLHNMFLPSWENLRTTIPWGLSVVAFSFVLVAPCALGVLAGSALLRSQRFAGIAVFMLLFGNLTIGTILPEVLHERNYLVIALPMAINHVGQHLFHQKRLIFDLHWQWSAVYIGAVCLFALMIICWRARRAEIG